MEVFVARQPIFNVKQEVFGYELLYRSSDRNAYTGQNGDEASLSVIRNVLLVIGAEKISGGRKAFVNFTKNLLLDGAASLLPKEIGVVEILEDVEPDPKLIEILQSIRSQGYPLALDDFVLRGNANNPFLDIVDIIKVDFRQTDETERKEIARRFPPESGMKLLAEKAETREEFKQAVEMGYSLFQGYFFCKPVIVAGRDIPGYKINYVRILKELSAEIPDYKAIQNFISHDPPLAYKLLMYINSSFFGLRREVTSIKMALELLGENEIRKWASIAVVMELGKDQPKEVLRTSLLRARLSEMLAGVLDFDQRKSTFFLMGLLSCMDVLMGRPMGEIIESIPIAADAKAALLGEPNRYKGVFDLVLSYERADWTAVPELASQLGMDQNELSDIYSKSIEWADGAFS